MVELTASRAVGRAGEVEARTRVGGILRDELVPPQLRLYSDGVKSVRGVGWNLLGPKVLVAREGVEVVLCPVSDDSCAGVTPVDP